MVASGQMKIKGLMGRSVISAELKVLPPLHERWRLRGGGGGRGGGTGGEVRHPSIHPVQTCAGSEGGLGGSPATSPLSLVAVHNGVSLTALPPKLHRKVMLHLH